MEERERRRIAGEPAHRHLERAVLDAAYRRAAAAGIYIPEDKRRQTLTQGGHSGDFAPEEGGAGGPTWRYGDGHYPYNPSPYADFVDVRSAAAVVCRSLRPLPCGRLAALGAARVVKSAAGWPRRRQYSYEPRRAPAAPPAWALLCESTAQGNAAPAAPRCADSGMSAGLLPVLTGSSFAGGAVDESMLAA